MKQRLCLHGLEVKHQAQLLNLVKKLLPGSTVKYKTKEEYFNDNDMYKYRQARFAPDGQEGFRVSCLWGVLLVSDRLLPVADIIIKFEADQRDTVAAVERLLQRLLASRMKFVLEEPDLSLRIDQLRGCYTMQQQSAYDKGTAMTALYCHLPWQLYGINKLWADILERGAEKTLWRQLRVKLRRLRSTLTFCKPLLPEEQALHWQAILKARTNILSSVREYDVALLTCSRLGQTAQEGQDNAVPRLTAVLQKRRQEAAVKSLRGLKLNRLTQELAQLQLVLYSVPVVEDLELLEFFRRRFGNWSEKLLELPELYPDLRDMEQLHRIRIKLKRFRYALQSVPELAASPRLLRSLKYLQDMLGRLHDDYINSQLLEQLQAEQPKLTELRYEAALFAGWEQAKADAAQEALPLQWDNFAELLAEWQEENL